MCPVPKSLSARHRRGLTLAELLISIAILGLLAGGLAALAMTVGSASDVSHSQWLVTQHARVTIERIERTVVRAYASEQFPGFMSAGQQYGSWNFSDTLVVWSPSGDPGSPDGLPRFNEVTIFTPDYVDPTRLLEIRLPYDSRTVPTVDDTAAWQNEIQDAKSNLSGAEVVLLTNMLRAESLPEYASAAPIGAIRFEVLTRPSMERVSNYKAGTIAWEDLPWAQDIRGHSSGLRQSWCRFELQLKDRSATGSGKAIHETIYPYFGSAAIFYELRK